MRRNVRTRTKRPEGLTDDREYFLLNGQWFFGEPFATVDAERSAWIEHRDYLLGKWIADEPGTRPAAWWKFDAPERRRRIDGKPHPFDDPTRIAILNSIKVEHPQWDLTQHTALSFGLPAILFPETDLNAKFEAEDRSLDRLQLWMTGERRRFVSLAD